MNIAIQGIPRQWSLKKVRDHFMHDIPCDFKTLFFNLDSKIKKTVYIELLSGQYDRIQILRLINKNPENRQLKLKAIIPKYVSQAFVANASGKLKANKKGAPKKRPGGVVSGSDQIMIVTHKEIITELQSKYTRLYNLSRKSPGNKLLENISRTIFERLKTIMETNQEASTTCFKLSGYYRKLHPHFGDFQMVLSTLHKLQDENGLARTDLAENDLIVVSPQIHMIDNVPFDKIRSVTDKYSVKIAKKILEHVRHLDSQTHQMDTPEDAARKKVRLELKNMALHLPSIIKQSIQRRLTPEKAPFHRVRIYGEPFLPSKDMMTPITRRFKAVHIQRSDRMFNLIKMNIPPSMYSSLIAMDGTNVGTAKLVIRSSEIPLFKIPDTLIAEMKAYFGITHDPGQDDFEEQDDMGEEMV
ncbi:uncharacterized protein LOC125237040 [Leguminivora glycinivorella]|uniref:uncharacterized protein LOC125237040 n=1 Tax=Leguminivora glycinivorella TaxID=1035111 RepID=UPI00200D047E|nr:uncharacterized protein LOC125237040 [Leguminivora glycinivorella]